MSDRPLTDQIRQGWALVSHSSAVGDSAMMEHCFLLQRHGQYKVLRVRKKMMGGGVVGEEIDV